MRTKHISSRIFSIIFSLLFTISLTLALPAETLADNQTSQNQTLAIKSVAPKVTLSFRAPKDKALDVWYQRLKTDRQLKQVIKKLRPIIGVNVHVNVVFQDDPSGRGPYFDPKTKTVYYSYQFVRSIDQLIQQHEKETNKILRSQGKASLVLTEAEIVQRAVATTFDFITATLYHELAHGIINLMNFPIVGNDETAADNLSAVLITTLNTKNAVGHIILSTVQSLNILSQSEKQLSPEYLYADTHGMGKDRSRQFVCLAAAVVPALSRKDSSIYEFKYAYDHRAECQQAYAYQKKVWLGLLKHGYVPVKHASLDGQISLEMKPATKSVELAMKNQLENDAYFQSLVPKLNKFLKLPRNVKLIYYAGSKESVPKVDYKQATIMIPYGYLADIVQSRYSFDRAHHPDGNKEVLARNAFFVALNYNIFLVNQQLAYLIMNFNQLPVVGSKLVAADNLATMILLNFIPKSDLVIVNGVIMHLQAIADASRKQGLLAQKNKDRHAVRRLGDQYDQAVKREYNILCLMLGNNPNKTLKVLKDMRFDQKDLTLLQNKKTFCHYEYKFQLKFWMRFLR